MFIQTIRKGNFITFPGLDAALIDNNLPPSVATAKGHLDQKKRNLRFTKTQGDMIEEKEILEDFFPKQELIGEKIAKMHNCFAVLQPPFTMTEKGYADLTGRFPHKSARGAQYFLVVYDYDSNAIWQKR